jgi:hypothetical protein
VATVVRCVNGTINHVNGINCTPAQKDEIVVSFMATTIWTPS